MLAWGVSNSTKIQMIRIIKQAQARIIQQQFVKDKRQDLRRESNKSSDDFFDSEITRHFYHGF